MTACSAHENPSLKKHYHVIGGEPSIADLVEEDEDDNCSDGTTRVVPLAPAKALVCTQILKSESEGG